MTTKSTPISGDFFFLNYSRLNQTSNRDQDFQSLGILWYPLRLEANTVWRWGEFDQGVASTQCEDALAL